MINLGTLELQSARLLLRRFSEDDYKEYYYAIASRQECSKYFPWNVCDDINIMKKKIQVWVNSYDNKEYYQWAIVLKEKNKLIGAINLHNIDVLNNSAETSYLLSPDYWNNGIMSEALPIIIKYGFEKLKLNRICADYFAGNDASGKVLTKAKMKFEGILRQRYYKNEEYVNSFLYAIVASDYFDSVDLDKI